MSSTLKDQLAQLVETAQTTIPTLDKDTVDHLDRLTDTLQRLILQQQVKLRVDEAIREIDERLARTPLPPPQDIAAMLDTDSPETEIIPAVNGEVPA